MENGVKKPWLSKTLWLNAIVALGALFAPGVSEYIAAQPDVVVGVFAVVNMILRIVSKDKLSIGE
jgi:hypothetical protein